MKKHMTVRRGSRDERSPVREHWTAQAPGTSDEAIAGSMLRAAASIKPFGPRELAEVGARLRSREHVRPRHLAWQLVIVIGLMLAGGALYAAVSHVLRVSRSPSPDRTPGATTPEKTLSRKTAKRTPVDPIRPPAEVAPPASASLPSIELSEPSPEASPELPAPAPAPAPRRQVVSLEEKKPGMPKPTEAPSLVQPEPASILRPALEPVPALQPEPVPQAPTRPSPSAMGAFAQAPSGASPPAMPSSPPTPTGPSALAKESRLLSRAIFKLRQEGEAEQALALLDQLRSEFGPQSTLAPEANATRLEALLRLQRHTQALALLDSQTLTTTGVGREMLVARAELRAEKGRQTAARQDFDLVLAAGGSPDTVTERALYGRAVCRGKAGDWQGARRDLERYLATFPNGRFVDKTRAMLNQDLR
jgi:hypothetical protein